MTLVWLALAAGGLTVMSPCVLPVLPLLFARRGSGRLFGGLALGFGAVLLLATAGGAWAAQAHGVARVLALGPLALFGLALALPALAARVLQPLQTLGTALEGRRSPATADWLLGVSTGLLWAPCAGPVLGLILTTAALQGGSLATAVPLLAYAAGASATLLLVRVLIGRAGQGLPGALKAVLPWAGSARRLVGVFVLAAVTLIATGWDTRLAAAFPGTGLERLEQAWLQRLQPPTPREPTLGPVAAAPVQAAQAIPSIVTAANAADAPPLPVLGTMPSLAGATGWLQSRPLGPADLKGKVVLVDFWTFGCVNCQRALPSLRDWSKRYRDDGLIVIGVHAPEFAFERDRSTVERAVRRMELDFPIALDNDFAVWMAWSNQYWPTLYLIDAQGRVRWRHVGEGAYVETEKAIRQLLDEARRAPPAGS